MQDSKQEVIKVVTHVKDGRKCIKCIILVQFQGVDPFTEEF